MAKATKKTTAKKTSAKKTAAKKTTKKALEPIKVKDTIGKQKFVEAYVAAHGGTLTEARDAYEKVFGLVIDLIKDGNNVYVPNLGTYKHTHRRERRGVDPNTQAEITIAPSNTIYFTTSEPLRRILSGK